VKVPDFDVGIFTPDEFSQTIHAALAHLIPLLANDRLPNRDAAAI
jgi:hypothetical protein